MHNLSFHPICYEAEISRGGGGGQRTLQSRKHTDPILRNRSGEARTRISSSYRHLEAHTHCVTGRDHSFSSRCVRGVSRRRVADGTHCSIESRERERERRERNTIDRGTKRGCEAADCAGANLLILDHEAEDETRVLFVAVDGDK